MTNIGGSNKKEGGKEIWPGLNVRVVIKATLKWLKLHQRIQHLFKVMFVQCALCGAVVGVMDYINPSSLGKMLEDIESQLNEIKSKEK